MSVGQPCPFSHRICYFASRPPHGHSPLRGKLARQVWLTGLTAVGRLPSAPPASTLWPLDDMGFLHSWQPRPSIRPYMPFLFVQSGFPLELPFPRFVASPQLPQHRRSVLRPSGYHCRGRLIPLTAVRGFVLQVWVSVSSRHLMDFHHSSHIAAVVQQKPHSCAGVRPVRLDSSGELRASPRKRAPRCR